MPIFPKYKRRHGGEEAKTSLYAKIPKVAWWREDENSAICPNDPPAMVETSKCSQNMPSG